MAEEIDKKILLKLRADELLVNLWRVTLGRVRRSLRKGKSVFPSGLAEGPVRTLGTDWEKPMMDLHQKGYAFIEDFLPLDLYRDLLDQWPSIDFFNPPHNFVKTVFEGGRTKRDQSFCYAGMPAFSSLFNSLKSAEFEQNISKMLTREAQLRLYSMTLSYAPKASYVAAHKDDATYGNSHVESINVIIYLDGTSGGTFFSKTHDFKDIVFEVKKFRNTCLIYDTRAPYYHGFRPIADKPRKMIMTNFKNT